MYLYIFDDGAPYIYNEVHEDDLRAANDGYITIYDCSDPSCIKTYYEGEWIPVEEGKKVYA